LKFTLNDRFDARDFSPHRLVMPNTSSKNDGQFTMALRVAFALIFLFSMATLKKARAQARADQKDVRKVIELNDGWRFKYGAASETVRDLGFDDAGWQQISVPHTWNRVGFYSMTQGPEANVERGAGWYRRKLNLPAVAKDRRYFLQFDGVAIVAEVWVNGIRVGNHKAPIRVSVSTSPINSSLARTI